MRKELDSKPIVVVRHAREPRPTIDDVLEREGFVLRYADLFADPALRFEPSKVAGLVVLGGAMNVDQADKYPFLTTEIQWVRRAVDHGTPVLGICLGSQLLAAALGARVRHNPVKEIGWYFIEALPAAADDPLCQHLRSQETVFQWHGDTFDLPSGAVQLARSERCENQAFRWGPTTWGLQFHPEVTPAVIESWLSDPEDSAELAKLDYIDPVQIAEHVPHLLPPMQSVADRMFTQFAEICRRGAQ